MNFIESHAIPKHTKGTEEKADGNKWWTSSQGNEADDPEETS